jgi:hypothetical protein
MENKSLIGNHYWVINGYGGEPDLEEQILVAEQEIQDYKNKQEFAKSSWDNECWENQEKLYEFYLYKNMEFYWTTTLEKLKELIKNTKKNEDILNDLISKDILIK